MVKILISSFILCLSACAGPAPKSYTLSEELASFKHSDQIACRYEKQVTGSQNRQQSNWYFWRQPQRTETRDEHSNQGEIWEYNDSGKYFYTRLFYNESIALEFVQGDLAAAGTAPSLAQLTSLIDPKTLGEELTLVSRDKVNNLPIEYYSGVINTVATEVDWLPALQLPARLVKKLPEGTVTLTLSECGNEAKFALKPIAKHKLDNFRRLDYTDLGDMEDDPVVQHIEHLLGGHHQDH